MPVTKNFGSTNSIGSNVNPFAPTPPAPLIPTQTPQQRSAAYTAAGVTPPPATGPVAPATTPSAPPSSGGGGYSAPAAQPMNANGTPYVPQGQYAPPPLLPNTTSGPDPLFSKAQGNLAPSDPSSMLSEEDKFFAHISKQFQPVFDAITSAEAAAETAANRASSIATSDMNAGGNARGLAGSSEATAMAADIEKARGAAIADAKQKQAQALENVTNAVATLSSTEFKDALSRSDTNSANYINQQRQIAQNALKGIALSGLALSDVKANNPQEYASLLQTYGGDENALAADYLASIPAPNMLNGGAPINTMGNSATYAYLDPITHELKFQTLQAPVPFAQNNDAKVVPGVGVVVYNKDTGEAKVIGGTADPTYKAIKDLTISGKAAALERTGQLIESSKALEASRVVGSQIRADKSIQNFLAIAPAFGRIQAAQEDITQNGINPANAGDLIEAVTQLNSGGGQITEGKLDLIRLSQSYQSQLQQLWQKGTGQGGAISSEVAKQMVELSTKIAGIYQSEFQKHTTIYNNRLKNVNGQDLSAFSPLTDIGSLPGVLDGSNDKSLQAEVSGGGSSQLSEAGFTQNSDGTWGAPDGTVLIDNGDGTYSTQQ